MRYIIGRFYGCLTYDLNPFISSISFTPFKILQKPIGYNFNSVTIFDTNWTNSKFIVVVKNRYMSNFTQIKIAV